MYAPISAKPIPIDDRAPAFPAGDPRSNFTLRDTFVNNPFRTRFRFLIRRADAARDERRFEAAAALYEEALRLEPDHAGAQIQCAHMLKEAGKLGLAEQHYMRAEQLRPDSADLALQIGHFYKISGRIAEARRAYVRARDLKPAWDAPSLEIANLETQLRLRNPETLATIDPDDEIDVAAAGSPLVGRTAAELARLVPSLAPSRPEDLLFSHHDYIHVGRCGRREVTYWGTRRTLRGIETVHGYLISEVPILEVQVLLNGIAIHRGPLSGGYILVREEDKERIKKYVYNRWVDFSQFAPGLHKLELRFFDAKEKTRSFHEEIVIAEPVPEEEYPDSDFLIAPQHDDPRPLDEQIRSRPSQIHQAKRMLFPDGVRNVLVMRTDQLGDMVASIPAMKRLRALVPGAHIVGLMTAANAELARTLDVFDEVMTVEFPDVVLERRRLMTLDEQERIRVLLKPYAFDLAIDLSRAGISRDLLLLSGAKFRYGVGGEEWPHLSSELIFNTRDRWTGHDMTPHSTKVLGLIEALGTILGPPAAMMRREDLSRDQLERYGIAEKERYVVLHLGARIGFSRWPYHPRLAELLLDQTDVKIVAITEDPSIRATFSKELLAHPRVIFLDQRLPFDDFDAILSYATVMVGNDSGPKHLASLRGTNVVTIFSARINWTEWGQENVGVIVSRKVPCAGCAILQEPENCGKDFACIVDIRPEEVFEAMMTYIRQQQLVAA